MCRHQIYIFMCIYIHISTYIHKDMYVYTYKSLYVHKDNVRIDIPFFIKRQSSIQMMYYRAILCGKNGRIQGSFAEIQGSFTEIQGSFGCICATTQGGKGVVCVAATNRLDVLDDALCRPGRFDRVIHVGKPNAKGREAVLRVHTRNMPLGPGTIFCRFFFRRFFFWNARSMPQGLGRNFSRFQICSTSIYIAN